MSLAAEQLRMHRRARGLSQAELACLIARRWCPGGASQVCAWEQGRIKPCWRNRRRIHHVTSGQVRASAWSLPAEGCRRPVQVDLLELLAAGGAEEGLTDADRGGAQQRLSQ